MSERNDGGPAFPESCTHDGYRGNVSNGMSLRDYFAGQALSIARSSMLDYELIAIFGRNRTGIERHEIQAADAYRIADAMLVARAKSAPPEPAKPVGAA